MIQYKRPVRMTDDYIIVDADGKTLLPDITWKSDLDHRARQEELGNWIVNALNNLEEVQEATSMIAESVNGNGHKEDMRGKHWRLKREAKNGKEKA